jgi:murein DD-endopeptidase / murein LD-carboxypeptidase
MKTRQFTPLWGNNAGACPLKVFHILWEKFYIFGLSSLFNLIKTTTMAKRILTASSLVFLLAAFQPAKSQRAKQAPDTAKAQLKFLDDIEVGYTEYVETAVFKPRAEKPAAGPMAENSRESGNSVNAVERATNIQLKYSILLDTEVESVQSVQLFQLIDDWYGTRYQYGGSTKKGIDCSAFTQVIYNNIFGTSLPRTAREQYQICKPVSRTQLQQGDLVFFNTRGGVSHVGMYLQNNKFVHASSSGGVMISDLFEEYWMRKFIGVRRLEKKAENPLLVSRF